MSDSHLAVTKLLETALAMIQDLIAEEGYLDFDDLSHNNRWSPYDIYRELEEVFSQSCDRAGLMCKPYGAVSSQGSPLLSKYDFYTYLINKLSSNCIRICREEIYGWE